MTPTCKICKGTGAGVAFPLFSTKYLRGLIPPGFKFGEICEPCCLAIEK